MTGPAFLAATNALFRDRNMGVDAIWKAGGAGGVPVAVRLIEAAPDEITDYGDTRLHRPVRLGYLRFSDAPAPAQGDHLIVGAALWRVMSKPVADDHRCMWRLELGPVE